MQVTYLLRVVVIVRRVVWLGTHRGAIADSAALRQKLIASPLQAEKDGKSRLKIIPHKSSSIHLHSRQTFILSRIKSTLSISRSTDIKKKAHETLGAQRENTRGGGRGESESTRVKNAEPPRARTVSTSRRSRIKKKNGALPRQQPTTKKGKEENEISRNRPRKYTA